MNATQQETQQESKNTLTVVYAYESSISNDEARQQIQEKLPTGFTVQNMQGGDSSSSSNS